MSNLFAQFKALIPQSPLLVGEVVATGTNTVTIELPGGDLINARGQGTVGAKVFVRDGVVESQAPSLPVELIDV